MISCKDILGVDERYCQKHKICHESKCECAWGYEGSECDSECEKGHWGLSCNDTCQEGCEICNHITGECTDNTNNGTIIGNYHDNLPVISFIHYYSAAFGRDHLTKGQ
jgi:hypothetical protein